MPTDLAHAAAVLRARYGSLLTAGPATGDPAGEACAAITAAAERLRGRRDPAGQLNLFSSASTGRTRHEGGPMAGDPGGGSIFASADPASAEGKTDA